MGDAARGLAGRGEPGARANRRWSASGRDIAAFERGVVPAPGPTAGCAPRSVPPTRSSGAWASAAAPITTWRLFQVVYQVIQLAALRAREADDPELLAELDTVDVLWFPTGGGKTEAYLGLIIIAHVLRPPARQAARRDRDAALPAADAVRPAAAANPRRRSGSPSVSAASMLDAG